ncbi:hypothetical protein GCM10010459_22160 [Microbacterium schleiferi]
MCPRHRGADTPTRGLRRPALRRDRVTRSAGQQLANVDMEIEEWRLRAEIEKRKRDQGEGSVG